MARNGRGQLVRNGGKISRFASSSKDAEIGGTKSKPASVVPPSGGGVYHSNRLKSIACLTTGNTTKGAPHMHTIRVVYIVPLLEEAAEGYM